MGKKDLHGIWKYVTADTTPAPGQFSAYEGPAGTDSPDDTTDLYINTEDENGLE